MSEQNKDIDTFLTYRGAGHVPLKLGIPFFILLWLLFSGVFTFFIFVLFLKLYKTAVVIGFIILSIGLWVKAECSIDSRAMQIRKLEIKNAIYKKFILNKKIVTVTSMKPEKDMEKKNVQRYFKKMPFIR